MTDVLWWLSIVIVASWIATLMTSADPGLLVHSILLVAIVAIGARRLLIAKRLRGERAVWNEYGPRPTATAVSSSRGDDTSNGAPARRTPPPMSQVAERALATWEDEGGSVVVPPRPEQP